MAALILKANRPKVGEEVTLLWRHVENLINVVEEQQKEIDVLRGKSPGRRPLDSGGGGAGWNWLGLYNPIITYAINDVVQMGVGTSAGMYLSNLSPNNNAPDSGIGWVQISTSAGTFL
jgi:hypothetical protein